MNRLTAGLLLLLCTATMHAQTPNPLVGAWERVIQYNAQGQQATTITAYVIFSANGYFSQTVLPTDRPKLDKPLNDMTKEELLARLRSVNARYGTYKLNGNKLTRVNLTALNPTDQGAEETQTLEIKGDTLILRTTTAGSKTENHFRRVK